MILDLNSLTRPIFNFDLLPIYEQQPNETRPLHQLQLEQRTGNVSLRFERFYF